MPRLRRRSGWPMPDSSSNCGELNAPALTTTARPAGDGIADAGATLPVEHQLLGQSLDVNMQVPAVTDRIEIAARRAHAAAAGNRRLTHRDAFLARAVVIRVVPDADLRRCLD